MIRVVLFIVVNTVIFNLYSQNSIQGKISNEIGEPLVGVNIYWKGTTRGTITGIEGDFSLMKSENDSILIIQILGYQTIEKIVNENSLIIQLKESSLTLNPLTISSNRVIVNSKKSPVDVGIINSEMLESTGAICLADGLNLQSGVRVESDCQTCNYTQVRMNGLGGGYSQILINNRPIFGSLIGLYGLEQFPVNWIDRIEVIRGGGSVIYGSGAIGGVINIIPKTPKENEFSIGTQIRNIDAKSWENNTDASMTIRNGKTAFSLFVNRRQRQAFDANEDGFSELPSLIGNSIGAKANFKPTEKFKIDVDALFLNEERNGGDQLDKVPHLREQSEQRTSNALLSTIDMEYFFSKAHSLRFFGGGQWMTRKHYTGFYQSNGYGNTENKTYQLGVQYNWKIPSIFKIGSGLLTAGFEMKYDDIFDVIEAYDYKVDQITRQTGTFLQFDWEIVPKLQLISGIRLNTHNYLDKPIITPRAALRWTIIKNMIFKVGYSSGYRAPQAFDADLHIAFAGGGISRKLIDPNLKEENSMSYTAYLTYDIPKDKMIIGFSLSGFYTQLNDAFVYEEIEAVNTGEILLFKTNNQKAIVQGISLEFKANFNYWVTVNAGWTIQKSEYQSPVEWSNSVTPEKSFLRTPNNYGYTMVTILPEKALSIDLNLVYTGTMKVPHFGGAPELEADEIYNSEDFWNFSAKLNYTLELKNNNHIKFSAGVNNILNAYQSNFDTGLNRDSNFIYGPSSPRTYFIGIKWELKKH